MDEKKWMSYENLITYDSLIKFFVNGKIFVGTKAEYETAYANGEIALNAIVVITDDENSTGGGSSSDTSSSTNAVLGYAVLGQMVLA